ncbi:MAG: peptidoglycan DD-metalloendopeptidase family protein [Chloroflexota bacterium]|nr:peptidoglycan DD-metalloendopeptidase family protein [Chloroflexota bacterium]
MERSAPHTPKPASRYLRAARVPSAPAGGMLAGGMMFIRLLPALVVFGIVGVVLIGRGFWGADQHVAAPSGAMETIDVSATSQPSDSVAVSVNVPGGQAVINAPTTLTDLTTTNYLARPAIALTVKPQRIDVVRALRDQTLNDIATQKGITATALMWANDISDPTTTLPVGIAIKVPPKGTMLHRVKESDTLEGIARAYQVTPEQITNYPGNNVQTTSDLVAGSYLLIPTEHLPARDRTIFYQVRPGDSLWKITQSYGLTKPTTIVWANSLPDNWVLKPNEVIAIPPTDGVIHVTEAADTQRNVDDAITQIAKNFACTAIPCNDPPSDQHVAQLRDAIFSFAPNGLTHGGRLVQGQEIVIPGGIPYVAPPPVIIPQNVQIDNPETRAPAPVSAPAPAAAPVAAAAPGPAPAPVPASAQSRAPAPAPAPARAPVPQPAPQPAAQPAAAPQPAAGFPGAYPAIYYPAQSYSCSGRNPGFNWPETGTITSNFTSSHNGIDIATNAGTPLAAAQAGWIVYAAWTSDGLGNAVYIDHGNGFVTVYGHMQSIAVSVGQRVGKGQTIGLEGSTGNSTGPHVHFMVIDNGRSCNPFSYLP